MIANYGLNPRETMHIDAFKFEKPKRKFVVEIAGISSDYSRSWMNEIHANVSSVIFPASDANPTIRFVIMR